MREIIITLDVKGKVNCDVVRGDIPDGEMVGIFETLKHIYLKSLIDKASYLPRITIDDAFDSELKEE